MDVLCGNIGRICRLILVVTTSAALVFSVLTLASCKFADPFSYTNPASVGLYRMFDPARSEKCEKYNYDNIDYFLRVSRASGIMACIFGILALLLAIAEALHKRNCCIRIFLSLAYILAEIFQGTTFLFFKSVACERVNDGEGTSCRVSVGATFSIAAVILYVVSNCLFCCTPKPERLGRKRTIVDRRPAEEPNA